MPTTATKLRRVTNVPAVRAVWVGGALALVACGGAAVRTNPDPTDLEESQEESKEMYGVQEGFMQDLNDTPSEQAGRRFERDTQPAVSPERETDETED